MTRKTIAVAVVCAAGIFSAGCMAGVAVADQPHMQSALNMLKSARAELIAATPNKGGHRETAIKLVNEAISETQTGMAIGSAN
jgi:hypothetical protein